MAKSAKNNFSKGDYVVYPTHGVGRVKDIITQDFSGVKLSLVVVHFEKSRLTLRVPMDKVEVSGLRKLASPDTISSAIKTLKSKPQVKRSMWSRRAQEYETKINSGDPVSIAEVVRDLHRGANRAEQSYSERQIYEQALGRLASEYAAIEAIAEADAEAKIENILGKS
jgi:CarD family transcriptional regulator